MDAPNSFESRNRTGLSVEFAKSEFYPGYDLIVDGVTQSNVDTENLLNLHLTYVRRLGDMIDSFFPTKDPLSVLHLGAGAMTLVRYIEETKPGSIQKAVELDSDIVKIVLETAPLQDSADAEIYYGDARDVVESFKDKKFDLIIADVYSGIATPKHLTTMEFYTLLREMLVKGGVVLVNVTDNPDATEADYLEYTRNQHATLKGVFGNVVAVIDAEDLANEKETNVVMAASQKMRRFDSLVIPTEYRRQSIVVEGELLEQWHSLGCVVSDE